MHWWHFALLSAAMVGSFVGGLVAAKAWKRRNQPLLVAVAIETLEQALRLDAALHVCESDSAWLKHDSKTPYPHEGIWLYVDEDGRIQIRSRHDSDVGWGSGETAAEAILAFRNRLAHIASLKASILKGAGS